MNLSSKPIHTRWFALVLKYTDLWTFIRNFRRGTSAGIPRSAEALRPMTEYAHRQLVALGPGFEYSDANVDESVVRVMKNASTGLDAACIVFAHSALDAHLFDCLSAVSAVAPEMWRERLNKRKVSLAEIESDGHQAVYESALADDLARLERESIVVKMNELFARCPGAANAERPHGYEWDLENLRRIDGLRHEIVHGGRIAVALDKDQVERDFDYLLSTGMFALHIAKHCYGSKLDAPPPD